MVFLTCALSLPTRPPAPGRQGPLVSAHSEPTEVPVSEESSGRRRPSLEVGVWAPRETPDQALALHLSPYTVSASVLTLPIFLLLKDTLRSYHNF